MILQVIAVECEQCGAYIEQEQPGRGGKTVLIRDLRRQGWRFGQERDLCPRCVQEEARAETERRYGDELNRWDQLETEKRGRRFQVRSEFTYPMEVEDYRTLKYTRHRARRKSFEHPYDPIWVFDQHEDRYLGCYRDGQWILTGEE